MPKKTIADWVAKGWTSLNLVAGQTVDVPYDPAAQDLVLKGQKFGADGEQLKGHEIPKLTTDETDTGCAITSSADATVLYKLVDQEADDDDEEA
jgi:hypothetical protein